MSLNFPIMSEYDFGREDALRSISSSLRDRPAGLEGLFSDLRLVECLIARLGDRSPEYFDGLQSVKEELEMAIDLAIGPDPFDGVPADTGSV